MEEMDLALIENWNKVVKPEDHVYHLGDFAWRNHLHYKSKLNGHIHWVLGNHDRTSEAVKSQFTSVHDLHICSVGKQKLFLFHYPCVTWWHKGYGTWHLYGHVHGGYSRADESSLDVGVDCHNYRPISFAEVRTLIEAKINAKLQNRDSQESETAAAGH